MPELPEAEGRGFRHFNFELSGCRAEEDSEQEEVEAAAVPSERIAL